LRFSGLAAFLHALVPRITGAFAVGLGDLLDPEVEPDAIYLELCP
jgi:hypothetical protein